MKRIGVTLAAVIALTELALGFVAYFTVKAGPPLTDGLGRVLSPSPLLMRILFGQERLWAGWPWFAFDMVVFWGGLALALRLAAWGLDAEKQ